MVGREIEGSGETILETIISYILIIGVATSFVALTIGLIIFRHTEGSWAIIQNPSTFIRGENFFSFLIHGISDSGSMSVSTRIMSLGVALLILTPYVRAILSVVYFGVEEDIKYFFITIFVLAILTWSLAVH